MKYSEIISCSRRTDVPAFNMDWVISKIKQGYVDVANPFNKKQISRVSLDPNDVRAFVWWSKDFHKWIQAYRQYKSLFTQYKGHYFQFTINSPSELEPNVYRTLGERLNQLRWLVKEFGTSALSYRFDPIILYKKQNSSTIRSNLTKFKYLIQQISEIGLREMIFSFATIYSKVERRMKSRGYIPIRLTLTQKKEILKKSKRICDNYGVKMLGCCQPDLLEIEGIEQAHCIDAYKLEKLIGEPIKKVKDTCQRDSCGCFKSKDIGGYHGIFKCKHNCSYCYANPTKI
ncbi:MAG: DUF1848 family protein [Candidatus Lokiarchaeota archaeon]|nr:DUF1848 family protein [Candidatus Lokiarchaeota archaeon]MBD3198397.1 DUF1848 family protein [Candidatus Lokiarchaeota archaeon]